VVESLSSNALTLRTETPKCSVVGASKAWDDGTYAECATEEGYGNRSASTAATGIVVPRSHS
jgi:hypothetical protein